MKLRIGTRGSRLALAQARDVAARLEAMGHAPEIVVIKTVGDRHVDRPFAEVGAPGIFVAEIESSLLRAEVELAVHSYKDLPSSSPEELVVAAVPERLDPADHLLCLAAAHTPEAGLLPLGEKARVGTASVRRQALLRHLRPDLELVHLRGNVPTRVGRLADGGVEAVLLAGAGLERLERAREDGGSFFSGPDPVVDCRLDPESFVPAPSQGAIALQVRRDDAAVLRVAEHLDDAAAHRCVRAERTLLALVEGGCQVPFGAWCRPAGGGRLELSAVLERGGRLRRGRAGGDDPEALAREVWAGLGEQGNAT